MKKTSSLIPSTKEIVVTVDADGNADGGHQFTRIDETTFLIDGLKYYYYKYKNEGLSVTGYDPDLFTGTAIIISKLIYNGRTMDVVGISCCAFKGCSNLTSITIPESVTSIEGHAFSGCRSLTSVAIPESVTSIDGYAFGDCTSLTSVTIGSGVASISYRAFEDCSSLTSIIIPESVTSIDEYAFSGCSSLTSITIPESVTSIGRYAFSGCSSLTSITISNSVTRIGHEAFSGCSSLTSIIIPESVTSIDETAWGWSSLTDVYCYVENVPDTYKHAFDNIDLSSATLHVPAGSVSAYEETSPWSDFGTIVAIE